jgi:uncharacterized membrane protein YcjF (UPF0283 family)
MSRRALVFVGSAAVAAVLMYVLVHDLAAFCNSSIRLASSITAGVVTLAWAVAAVWDALSFWR